MTVEDLMELDSEIKDAEKEAAKLDAGMEVIQEQWKEKYGCTELHEMKDILAAKNEEAEELNTKLGNVLEKIEKAGEWDE